MDGTTTPKLDAFVDPKRGKHLFLISIITVAISFIAFLLLYFSDNAGGIKDVKITNITANGVTISWTTERPAVGKVIYGTSNSWSPLLETAGKDIAYDDRDTEQNHEGRYVITRDGFTDRITHHVTLKDLDPETEYFFRVGENLRYFEAEQVSFKTISTEDDLKSPEAMYGRVFNFDNSGGDIEEGIVYYKLAENNSESSLYSEVITNQTFSTDIAYIKTEAGENFDWDEDTATVTLSFVTDKGEATWDFTMNDYQPLPESYVNVEISEYGTGTKTESQTRTNSVLAQVDSISDTDTSGRVLSAQVGDACDWAPGWRTTCLEGQATEWAAECKVCSSNPTQDWQTDCGGRSGGKVTNAYPQSNPNCAGSGGQQDVPNPDLDNACPNDPTRTKHMPGGCNPPQQPAPVPQEGGGGGSGNTSGRNNAGLPIPPGDGVGGPATPCSANDQYDTCGEGTNGQCCGCSISSGGNQCFDNNFASCQEFCATRSNNTPPSNDQCNTESITCSTINVGCSDVRVVNEVVTYSGTAKYLSCTYERNGTTVVAGYQASLQAPCGLGNLDTTNVQEQLCQGAPSQPLPTNQNLCPGTLPQAATSCSDFRLASSTDTNNPNMRYCIYGLNGQGSIGINYNIETQQLLGDLNFVNQSCQSILDTMNQNSDPDPAEIPVVLQPGQYSATQTCIDAGQHSCAAVECEYAPLDGSVFGFVPGSTTDYTCSFSYAKRHNSFSDIRTVTESRTFTDGCNSVSNGFSYTSGQQEFNSFCSSEGFGQSDQDSIIVAEDNPKKVLGSSKTVKVLDSGVYKIGGAKVKPKTIRVNQDQLRVAFYYDANGDGKKQASEEYVSDLSTDIELEKETDLITYDFNQGWNLIALETASAEYQTAADLISVLNSQGINATHIAGYSSGDWELYSEREDENGETQAYGDPFSLVPGKGYFIKTLTSGSIEIEGNRFAEAIPVDLSKGWNLISIQSDEEYSAASLIEACEAQNMSCDIVSRFESGRYENVVKDAGTIFGQDFNIVAKRGYFVRVRQEGGRLEP